MILCGVGGNKLTPRNHFCHLTLVLAMPPALGIGQARARSLFLDSQRSCTIATMLLRNILRAQWSLQNPLHAIGWLPLNKPGSSVRSALL